MDTWTIGIRIEHFDLLELSLVGSKVSLKTVRPSQRSKISEMLELILYKFVLDRKFQNRQGILISLTYWVYKFQQGYNFWEFDFSPHKLIKLIYNTFSSSSLHFQLSWYNNITIWDKCTRKSLSHGNLIYSGRWTLTSCKLLIFSHFIKHLRGIQNQPKKTSALIFQQGEYRSQGNTEVYNKFALLISKNSVHKMNFCLNNTGTMEGRCGPMLHQKLDEKCETTIQEAAASVILQQYTKFTTSETGDSDNDMDCEDDNDYDEEFVSVEDMIDQGLPWAELVHKHNAMSAAQLELHITLTLEQLRTDV
jgi:hypothetical protein